MKHRLSINLKKKRIMNTHIFSIFRFAVITSLISVAVACGGTGQDTGAVSNINTVVSGRAIDGALARGMVFVDSNNNGTRDPWEAFAFTDNDGYYSYNPMTEKNYCASTASVAEAQYCLVVRTTTKNAVIRVDGGYDTLTNEPFIGQMSRRVDISLIKESDSLLVSPISSLLTNIETVKDRSALLSSLSLEESDLDVDYLNTDGAGSIDTNLLNKALKIHKVVAVLSDRLTDTYTEIGKDFGVPNDATSAVYPNLAQQILTNNMSLDEALNSPSTLVAVLDNAESALREVYARKEFTMPADLGSPEVPDNFSRVVDLGGQISSVVDSLINENTLSEIDVKGGARALETVVIKALGERSGQRDVSIDAAVDFFTKNTAVDLIDAAVTALGDETSDVTSFANNDFSGDDFDSVDEITEAASLPEGAETLAGVGGKRIRISDLNLGSGLNDLKDSEVDFYLNGEALDIEGSFVACVKFIDGAKADGTLGEGNTRGELVNGFWSMLGARENDPQSYNLLLTISFLGATYQAIVKSVGSETRDDIDYERFRFDNDGEYGIWHSKDGITEYSGVPVSSSDCEQRLPSRIGI